METPQFKHIISTFLDVKTNVDFYIISQPVHCKHLLIIYITTSQFSFDLPYFTCFPTYIFSLGLHNWVKVVLGSKMLQYNTIMATNRTRIVKEKEDFYFGNFLDVSMHVLMISI